MAPSESHVPVPVSTNPVRAAAAHATSKHTEPGTPKNCAAAVLLPDAAEWKRAVLNEMQAMEDNEEWELVVALRQEKPNISSRIVLDCLRAEKNRKDDIEPDIWHKIFF